MEPATQYIIVAAAIMLASIIRGATGFGLAMIAMPLVTLIMPYRESVVVVVLVNLVFSVIYIARYRGTIMRKYLSLILIFSVIGVTVGVILLKEVNQELLKAVAGVTIVLFASTDLAGLRIRIKSHRAAYTGASLLGGVLAGAASIGGPFAAIFLGGTDIKPRQFRYSMSLFFLVSYSYAASIQTLTGMVTRSSLIVSMVAIPAMVAGLIAGERIGNRFRIERFRGVVNILLLVSGSVITWQAVRTLTQAA